MAEIGKVQAANLNQNVGTTISATQKEKVSVFLQDNGDKTFNIEDDVIGSGSDLEHIKKYSNLLEEFIGQPFNTVKKQVMNTIDYIMNLKNAKDIIQVSEDITRVDYKNGDRDFILDYPTTYSIEDGSRVNCDKRIIEFRGSNQIVLKGYSWGNIVLEVNAKETEDGPQGTCYRIKYNEDGSVLKKEKLESVPSNYIPDIYMDMLYNKIHEW